MLKVKIKSLSEEARIIRLEEKKATGRRKCPSKITKKSPHPDFYVWLYRDEQLRISLREHRIWVVRQEQRLSLLAYAFLRGKPRATVEPKCQVEPSKLNVARLVERFGTVGPRDEQVKEFERWWAGQSQQVV